MHGIITLRMDIISHFGLKIYDTKYEHWLQTPAPIAKIDVELSDLVVYLHPVRFRTLDGIIYSITRQYTRYIYIVWFDVGHIHIFKHLDVYYENSALLRRPTAWREITSLGEKAARTAVRKESAQFVRVNTQQCVRTYPAGTRVDSSNYNPMVCQESVLSEHAESRCPLNLTFPLVYRHSGT